MLIDAQLKNSQERAWFNTTLGQYLAAKEQMLFDQAVFDLFGFNALQMGSVYMDLLRNSRITHRYYASEFSGVEFSAATLKPHLSCCDDFLPIADSSLDLLLLPHRLEFSERPHQTLREAARVIMPDGHLVISGFNRLSTWGATAKVRKWLSKNQSYPWRGNFIGLMRLKDWLALLGFEVILVEKCCHIPPFEQASWHQYFAFLDHFSESSGSRFGGVYFIVAKKRVLGMMPIKPNWKSKPLKIKLAVRQQKTRHTQSKNE